MGMLQVLAKARVPIIKFETVGYGNLAFDISFDVPNGPQVWTRVVWNASPSRSPRLATPPRRVFDGPAATQGVPRLPQCVGGVARFGEREAMAWGDGGGEGA
eukprot:352346-Chlamydomonas_euryale.AAC.2